MRSDSRKDTRRLERTGTPGIFRKHSGGCARSGRCPCPWVVVWKHCGRQHKSFHRTYVDAREGKGDRRGPEGRRQATGQTFEDYASGWLDNYRGRTSRGLSERTRRAYRRDLERWAFPYFRRHRLADVEPPDVREFVAHLEREGLR